MNNCIFCKIISKEIPGAFLHEDDVCIAFRDIHPKTRIHILLVPKKHIPTIADMEEGDEKIIGHLVKIGKEIAKKEGLKGYKLVFHVGKDGGQEIFHVHLHLMGGGTVN